MNDLEVFDLPFEVKAEILTIGNWFILVEHTLMTLMLTL